MCHSVTGTGDNEFNNWYEKYWQAHLIKLFVSFSSPSHITHALRHVPEADIDELRLKQNIIIYREADIPADKTKQSAYVLFIRTRNMYN